MTEPTPHVAQPAAPQSAYASWGDRAVATLWDFVYNLPPVLLAIVSAIVLGIGVTLLDGDSSSVPGLSLACAGGGLLFASMCWAIWRQINNYVVRQGRTGQTWGKAKNGLWVLDEATGAAPGWASCLGRWFLHGLINQAFYLDYLWPLWDKPKAQTLTDKILTTVVIKRG